jgi:putative FmdB family regulatory protein
MPIYEYECLKCGDVFEEMQKISDEPLKVCDCGKKGEVKRLISAPAVRTKGEGWAADGYDHSETHSTFDDRDPKKVVRRTRKKLIEETT